jgi:hypothetical protein
MALAMVAAPITTLDYLILESRVFGKDAIRTCYRQAPHVSEWRSLPEAQQARIRVGGADLFLSAGGVYPLKYTASRWYETIRGERLCVLTGPNGPTVIVREVVPNDLHMNIAVAARNGKVLVVLTSSMSGAELWRREFHMQGVVTMAMVIAESRMALRDSGRINCSDMVRIHNPRRPDDPCAPSMRIWHPSWATRVTRVTTRIVTKVHIAGQQSMDRYFSRAQ